MWPSSRVASKPRASNCSSTADSPCAPSYGTGLPSSRTAIFSCSMPIWNRERSLAPDWKYETRSDAVRGGAADEPGERIVGVDMKNRRRDQIWGGAKRSEG